MVRTEYGYGIKPSIPSKSTETPVEPLPDGVVPQTPAVMMGAKMGKAVNRRPNIKDLIKKNITYRPSERDMIWRDQKILKRNSCKYKQKPKFYFGICGGEVCIELPLYFSGSIT